MRADRPPPRGVTLVELMVAVSLVSVVAIGFGSLYGAAQTSMRETMVQDQVEHQLTHAMEHMTRHLRQAAWAEWVAVPGGRQLRIAVRTDRRHPELEHIEGYAWQPPAAGQITGRLVWADDVNALADPTRVVMMADSMTAMDVWGAAAQAPLPPLTRQSPSAIIRVEAVSRGQTIQRTASVQPRGWTPSHN